MDIPKKTKDKIQWEAWEFRAQAKSKIWYAGFALIAIVLFVYGWYTKNLLTMFTFIVLTAVAMLYSLQKPRRIVHELTKTGIMVGQVLYPFRNIKKFWIFYNSQNKTLNFETTAYLNNQISLQLGHQSPVEVKEFLKQYLTEDLDHQESLTEVIARKIKF